MTELEKIRDYQYLLKKGIIHQIALKLIALRERYLNGWELKPA